jgi:hypothetical protein
VHWAAWGSVISCKKAMPGACSSTEKPDDPQKQAQEKTEQQARRQREVEARVLSHYPYVARQTPQPGNWGGQNPDQTDSSHEKADDQKHPAEAYLTVHVWFNLFISARRVASAMIPTWRAANFPSLKIKSAGIDEML